MSDVSTSGGVKVDGYLLVWCSWKEWVYKIFTEWNLPIRLRETYLNYLVE